jgi:hypothetical protein
VSITSITNVLGSVAQKSEWATWLTTSSATAASETRAFVDRALGHLSATTLGRVTKRLRRSDGAGIDAVIHELVAFEMCRGFRLNPTFEPDAGSQQPDLSIQIDHTTIWCDVFVTYRPTSTLTTFAGARGFEDSGQAAKKIADAVSTKATKYAKLNGPLIVFVMFGGYNVGMEDLETALYGSTVDEVAAEGVSVQRCHEDWHQHGILCPPTVDSPHMSLSAVLGCDWFDTLNRTGRGRRMHCVVYHHWRARFALPLGVFAPFCDLSWQIDTSRDRFLPHVTGDSSVVMSTTSDDPPRFAPYSTLDPW